MTFSSISIVQMQVPTKKEEGLKKPQPIYIVFMCPLWPSRITNGGILNAHFITKAVFFALGNPCIPRNNSWCRNRSWCRESSDAAVVFAWAGKQQENDLSGIPWNPCGNQINEHDQIRAFQRERKHVLLHILWLRVWTP